MYPLEKKGEKLKPSCVLVCVFDGVDDIYDKF